MAYIFQDFLAGQIFTEAEADQTEINVRDHIHGQDGVSQTPLVFDRSSALAIASGTDIFVVASTLISAGLLGTEGMLKMTAYANVSAFWGAAAGITLDWGGGTPLAITVENAGFDGVVFEAVVAAANNVTSLQTVQLTIRNNSLNVTFSGSSVADSTVAQNLGITVNPNITPAEYMRRHYYTVEQLV